MIDAKDSQHYRIFLDELQEHYRLGDVTAKGALKLYFRLRLAEGWKCKIRPLDIRRFFSRWDDKKTKPQEMGRTTFWRAMNDLRDEGEIAYDEPDSLVVRLGQKTATNSERAFQKWNNVPNLEQERTASERSKNGTGVPNLEQSSQIWNSQQTETLSGKASESLTNLLQISYKSVCVEAEPEKHTQEKGEPQEEKAISQEVIPLEVAKEEPAKAAPRIAEKKYDPRLGMRPPQEVKYSATRPGIPDGPWKESSGRLNEAFIRHTVTLWKQSRGADFSSMADEDVAGLVISHFLQKPHLLMPKWQAFAERSYRHAEGAAARMAVGIAIGEQEQRQLVASAPAIAHAAQSQSQERIFASAPQLPATIASVSPQIAQSKTESSPVPLAIVSSSDDFSETERAANIAKLRGMIAGLAGKKTMPKATLESTPSTAPKSLSQARLWLSDKVLRPAAVTWAERAGFQIIRDEEGIPYDIEVELDF